MSQLQNLESELASLCRFWGLPSLSVNCLPHKTLLDGSPVEGEKSVVHLGETEATDGMMPMQVFQSADPRDVLGNANWARGWMSCLYHLEDGTRGRKDKSQPGNETPSTESARYADAHDVALWAAQTQGVSLLYAWDGAWKTQGGVKRRAMRARAWLFELESGAQIAHSSYGGVQVSHCSYASDFGFREWLAMEGRERYGLLSRSQANPLLSHASVRERLVKGAGPLCPALERTDKRIIWRGWKARQIGASPNPQPPVSNPKQTRLCFDPKDWS